MDASHKKKRKEARKLFLSGECSSNAEIGRKLGLKPHTVAKYRKEEDWDGLRLKSDRHAAQRMAEQCASDRVSLEVKPARQARHGSLVERLATPAHGVKQSPAGETALRRIPVRGNPG
jgi:uncharacterized protein YjcR